MEKAASSSWPAASASWSGGASSSLNPTQFLTDPDDWAASVLRRPTEQPAPSQEQEVSSFPQEGEPSAPFEPSAPSAPSSWSDAQTTPQAARLQYPPSPPASYPPPPLTAAPPTPPTPVVPLQQPIARQTPLSQPRAALLAPHASSPAHTPQPHTAEEPPEVIKEDAQSAFKRGFKALAENNYIDALQAFSKAFQQQPSPLFEAYFAWTLFLSEPKHPLQSKIAMMHLEKAKKADPQQEKIYLFLGNIYQQQRRFEDALALYREALQAMPDSREVYREMRLLELQMTRHRGV
jgi:TolA-binding protein